MGTPVNWRWDEFKNQDQSLLISAESVTVPASGDPYVALNEIPRQDSPSTVVVYAAGDKATAVSSDGTYVYQGNPATDYVASPFYCFGRDDAGTFHSFIYRTYLKFDVSAMAASAGSVKIYLYTAAAHAVTDSVFRVTSAWTGHACNYGNQPTFSLVPESSVSVLQQPSWYAWDITALYNSWKSGAVVNNGVVFRSDEIATDTNGNWGSPSSAFPPRIEVIGSSIPMTEVAVNIPPAVTEYAVSYQTGRMRFNPTKAGSVFSVDYRDTGSPVTIQNRN